jgi:hypothetical protein
MHFIFFLFSRFHLQTASSYPSTQSIITAFLCKDELSGSRQDDVNCHLLVTTDITTEIHLLITLAVSPLSLLSAADHCSG